MGGLLSRLLRRGKSQAETDMKNQLLFRGADAEMYRGDNDQDIKWRENLAIRYEVIHDEDKEDILAQKCLKPAPPVVTYDAEGNVVWERRENGEILCDGNGNPIPKYQRGYQIDDKYAALRNMVSHVNRLVFLKPQDRRLVELLNEDIIEDVKTNSKESDFDNGQAAYLNSIMAEEILLLNDAENGNKVKAMLENRSIKTFDMTMGSREKKGVF